jgi:hypothetical protein
VKQVSLALPSSLPKPVKSCSPVSTEGSPSLTGTSPDGDLPGVGETGDCDGVVERALLDRGVKKRASGDDVVGEEVNRSLK